MTTYTQLRWRVDQLKAQFARRLADSAAERAGIVVLYALDNDVITLITAPWRTENQYYLQALSGDNDSEASEAFAYIVAEFFFSSRTRLPYVIVPPGEIELEGMWNVVYSKAKGDHDEIASGLEGLLSDPSFSAAKDETRLFALVTRALEAVYGRGGAITELQRISRVLEAGCIRRMNTVLDETGVSPFPQEDADASRKLARFEHEWLQGLNRVRRPHERPTSEQPANNLVDAAVLARIEWMNWRFIESGTNRRVCLITGDSSIERVAAERGFRGDSFAQQFIRTPACFLADRDFFQRAGVEAPDFLRGAHAEGQQEGTSVAEWLEVVFPATDFRKEDLRSISDSKVMSEANNARSQWARYLKSTASALRMADEQFFNSLDSHLGAASHVHIAEVKGRFEQLRDRLMGIGTDAITRFGVSAALAGFWSLDPSGRTMQRSIPGVKFDSFVAATDIAKELRESGTFERLQRQVDRAWIRKLQSEDPSGYTTFIIFALAFGLGGEWKTALTIARSAVSIATQRTSAAGRSSIKGDEAAYLCAVFSRFCASTRDDLKDSERWLDQARRLQKAAPLRASLTGVNIETYEDPRFAAESLALRLTRLFFAEFLDQGDIHDQLARTLPIREECLRHLRVMEDAKRERADYIRLYVQEQLAVNVLQLQLLAASKGQVLMHEEARACLAHLEQQLDPSKLRNNSQLVYFTYLCGAAVFAGNTVTQTFGGAEMLLTAIRTAGANLRLMPYDPERVRIFSKVAASALQGLG